MTNGLIRRAAVIGTIVVALAASFVSSAGAVTVGAGLLGGFENDGNLVVNSAPNADWGSTAVVPVTDDTADSGFQGSSKELKPSEWTCNSGGANPGKGNLLRAYLGTTVVDYTKFFLNLAWVRENASGQGDVHVNYEFNQSGSTGAAPTSGSCPLTRVAGDLLVTYDFPGGAANPAINLYRWVPLASPTSSADGDWVDTNLPASAARAAVNQATVTDPIHGGSILTQRFGEATIDLTAALAAAGIGEDCRQFGSAHIRSRSSGESWTSALQDNMPGIPVSIDTCPAVPALSTTATQQVVAGNPIADVAHMTDGDNPSGTIVFKAFGPDDADCSGSPAYTSPPVTVAGNGDYASPAFANPVAGTYRWIAYFTSSNEHENESVSSSCNDAGETSVVLPAQPGMTLDKKVNGGDHASLANALLAHEDDALTYTVDIENTGNVPLVISNLSDSLHSGLESDCNHGNGYTLPVGGSISCSYPSTATGSSHNVASATGTPLVGDPVSPTDGTFVKTIHPDITITKSTEGEKTTAHVGEPITYTFFVRNAGDIVLTNVSVDDDKLGHIGTITTLAVDESKTLEFETVATIDVTNTATACGYDPIEKQVCDDDNHTIDVIHPAITIEKTAADQALPGQQVTYHFKVTNTGDVTLTNIVVTDDKLGTIDTIDSLVAGASQTLDKTVDAPADDTRNVATACGDDPLQLEVCGHDDHTIDIINPGLDVTKSAKTVAHEGDEITYTFAVHNIGDVTLTDIVVIDDLLGPIGTIESLVAGASTELTKTTTIPTDTDGVDNTVTACAPKPLTEDDQLCDTDIHHVTVIHPAITIDKKVGGADHKTADDALNTHKGDEAGYTVDVTNTGDTALEITALQDTLEDAMNCDHGVGFTLVPGAHITCSYTSESDGDAHNVVSVTGSDSLEKSVSASDETFTHEIHPAIKITKTADPTTVEPGQDVTYTYVVTNTGDTALSNVSVDDDVLGHIGTIASLAAGESKTLTKTVTIASDSPRINVATACGTDVLGLQVCGTARATISIVLPVPPTGRVPSPRPSLPATGFRMFLWIALAMNLIAAGVAMTRTKPRSRLV